jgi:prepilin-type N-terminal cleavage/methylation domain-containing protein
MSLGEVFARQQSFKERRLKIQKGFTLLEILISLAILGGLLITVIYTLNYHMGITEKQFYLTNITNLAKEKMGEMEQTPQNSEGKFPEPYDLVHYKTDIKDSSFSGMQEIVVAVDDGKGSIVLSELIRKKK